MQNAVDIKLEQLLRYCKNLFCLTLLLERLSTLCKLVSMSLGTEHFNSHVSIVLGLAFSLGLIFAAPKTQVPRPISFPAAA